MISSATANNKWPRTENDSICAPCAYVSRFVADESSADKRNKLAGCDLFLERTTATGSWKTDKAGQGKLVLFQSEGYLRQAK